MEVGSLSRWLLGLALCAAPLATWTKLGGELSGPQLAVLGLTGLTLIGCAIAWVRGWQAQETSVAVLMLGVMLAALELHLEPTQTLGHGRFLPWLALAGWRMGAGDRERGLALARGLVAAPYVLAGAAKLVGDGSAWFRGDGLALVLVEHASGPLASLRMAVALSPGLCAALAIGTLLVELLGPALLLPATRKPWIALAIAMHAGIALLMGYVYLDWVLVLAALGGVSALGPARRSTSPS
jgi:hypothetical protein